VNASQSLRRAGEARVAAAQATLDAIEQRYLANEPLTPDFLARLMTWSQRLMDAKVAVADSRADRVAAAERHVARCRELLHVLERRRSEPPDWVLATQRYHVADADYRLVRIEAGR